MRLLILGLVFAVWSSAVAAPVDNTTQHKGIIFPKKLKGNATEKVGALKNLYQKDIPSGNIKGTEAVTESSKAPSSPSYIPLTVDKEFAKSGSIFTTQEIEKTTLMPLTLETEDSEERESSVPDESFPVNEEGGEIPLGIPMPPDATDGLIEYNLGNPLALRLHLPWWPLKDMLRSIQDAISLMNLTMSRDTLDTDATKTKTVRFDDRNYTLKVKVLKPSENNRLLVRLISLTPVIEEGKIPMEKVIKVDEERTNEALTESEKKALSQMKQKKDDEDGEEENKEGDDDDEKEKKSKSNDSKKEKDGKKKKEEKEGSDSEADSD